jgi:TolB-like protein
LPLPKLSFDFLLAMIEAAPGIVSLDELMDRVWAGVIVSPETVSQRAKLLRDALGDDSRSPRYLLAVRGRGYRLIAAVSPVPADAALEARVADEVGGHESPARPFGGRWPVRVAVLVTVTAILVALGWMATRPAGNTGAAPERSIAVLPFESLGPTGEERILAFGIAEAVLHQLANQPGLVVIARTSSFALEPEPGDARAIGRTLNVGHLLEGSVQRQGETLRVTAQLIDASTGAHVWSLRFDRPLSTVFAVQDEIATRVAQALKLTLQADGKARMAGQGTEHVEAYLAYLQGRTLLATGRLTDAKEAVRHFAESLRLDPTFAAAHVSRAEAEVFAAEFDITEPRAERFPAALRRASDSVEKALALDPGFGPAYVLRAYLEAFTNLRRAEASYRLGLQFSPNDARGYAGLASVLFEQPARRDEALRALERARRIDPLEPAHDVAKAVFLLYDRGDLVGAEGLLRNVLQRQPQYVPALTRLGELEYCCGADPSEAIVLLERAIALDPRAVYPRRVLVRAYLAVGDVGAAEAVAANSPGATDSLQVPVLVRQGEWRRAGEAAYAALAQQQTGPIDEFAVTLAIRRDARFTGDHGRAIAALEELAGVTWRADGSPDVASRPGLRVASLGLADMLQASGDVDRARRLIDLVLEQMTAELRAPNRRELWYHHGMSVALALRGDFAQALDWIRRGVEQGYAGGDLGIMLDAEPAFDGLRESPEYRALEHRVLEHARRERAELERLRDAGELARAGG